MECKNWHRAEKTDLHSAFDQIEGNDCCVRGATAHNPTKATQEQILLRAKLTTVSLWGNRLDLKGKQIHKYIALSSIYKKRKEKNPRVNLLLW